MWLRVNNKPFFLPIMTTTVVYSFVFNRQIVNCSWPFIKRFTCEKPKAVTSPFPYVSRRSWILLPFNPPVFVWFYIFIFSNIWACDSIASSDCRQTFDKKVDIFFCRHAHTWGWSDWFENGPDHIVSRRFDGS